MPQLLACQQQSVTEELRSRRLRISFGALHANKQEGWPDKFDGTDAAYCIASCTTLQPLLPPSPPPVLTQPCSWCPAVTACWLIQSCRLSFLVEADASQAGATR
jgi:hypothetical protein